TVDTGFAEEGTPLIGHNLEAVIAGLEKKMLKAAADLEFETAARLRDEIKRLRETELAVADDPLARQADVEDRAGSYGGGRKYGKAPRGSDPPGLTPKAASSASTSRSNPPTPRAPRSPATAPAPANPRSTRWAPLPTARSPRATLPLAACGERGGVRGRASGRSLLPAHRRSTPVPRPAPTAKRSAAPTS